MEGWILYGVLAAAIWGIYVVLLKVATYKLYPSLAFVIMTLGIMVTLAVAFPWRSNGINLFTPGALLALLAGLLWGGGMAFVTRALWLPATAVSRLAPLYNVNTLVATILGILALQEIPQPSKVFIVVLGALLVVVGGYLVTRKPHAKNQTEVSEPTVCTPSVKICRFLRIPEWILPQWIAYGIPAILMWGSYIVCLKLAVSPNYYAMGPWEAFLLMVLGITIASSMTFLLARRGRHHSLGTGDLVVSLWLFIKEKQIRLNNFRAGVFALVSGIFWGVGMLIVIHALSDLQAPVARLTPLYNTNTVIAAGLGLLFLREWRNWKGRDVLFVFSGAVSVALGGTFVSI